MDERREDTNEILVQQQALMNLIFAYQLKYGVEALSWNLNVTFNDKVIK